jgi:hypothetical protein
MLFGIAIAMTMFFGSIVIGGMGYSLAQTVMLVVGILFFLLAIVAFIRAPSEPVGKK